MRFCILCDLLKERKGLVGAEVGVSAGANARGLVERLKPRNLFLIDPYVKYIDSSQGTGLVGGNIEQVRREAEMELQGQPVSWILIPSPKAADQFKNKSLDFVYIDGAHDYQDAKNDIVAWLPKIKKGGVIAGHDYDLNSVHMAVDDFFNEKKLIFECTQGEWWYRV